MSHPAILPVGIPMEFDVLGLSLKETKVAGRIVQLIAIKVMDFFARFNMAFDETSHYKNMFKNIPFFLLEPLTTDGREVLKLPMRVIAKLLPKRAPSRRKKGMFLKMFL